jgi:hypothetical protein
LFTIQLIRHGRAHAAAHIRLDVQKFFTFVGAVRDEMAIRNNLDHKIAGRCHCAAADAGATVRSPFFFLRDRIPSDQRSALAFNWSRANCW